ncbi:unnamed protein product, partial [marine sediment metagenome]
MAIIVAEEALLREPNLWVPGKKPVGNVKIAEGYKVIDSFLFKTLKHPGFLNYIITTSGTVSITPSKGLVGNNGVLTAEYPPLLSSNKYTILLIANIDLFDSWGGVYMRGEDDASTPRWGLQRYSSTTTMRYYHNTTYVALSNILTTTLINAGLF